MHILAPAKINLFLEVLGKRSDGYHEIETFMAPVTLYDTLFLTATDGEEIQFSHTWGSGWVPPSSPRASTPLAPHDPLPPARENLVVRALELLRARAGICQGAKAFLVKRIPAAAGLGGASSDAAAALLLGNRLWNVNWSCERLAPLAAELGSDVPFFLLGGAAMCRGRGERLERQGSLPARFVVVVKPPEGLSTAEVYRHCRPAQRPRTCAGLAASWRAGGRELKRDMFNRLQEAAGQLSPRIVELERKFERLDCVAHQMSGSGSSYFGVCRSMRHARLVAARLRAGRFGSVFCLRTAGFAPLL